jgi:general secretion pathway protein E
MAQRLVRKLCQDCARPHPERLRLRNQLLKEMPEAMPIDLSCIREPVGCDACGGTGYSGRTTVCELLVIDDAIREAIGVRSRDQRAMTELARTNGFCTLYEDGLAKVIAGETTLEEVLRVTRAA